ncbi:MAG: hypothetical protein KJ995_00445 [Candidatus Omnitrophica bacterium]|nr:hypothetical protein [Candidatus Omnitrophota bacterium]MBU1850862.1 hypothetical protein [Candidatus Omnitrophota bacterium]
MKPYSTGYQIEPTLVPDLNPTPVPSGYISVLMVKEAKDIPLVIKALIKK